MTRRERIKSIINGEVPDYTPFHFDLTMKMTDRLAEHYGTDAEGVEDLIGNHLLYVDFTGPNGTDNGYRSIAENGKDSTDEFGVEWDVDANYDIGDWAMVGHPIEDMDFDDYVFPDGKGEGRYDHAREVIKQYPDRFRVLRVTGPFDYGWHLTGLEDFMAMMILEEDLTTEVLGKTTDYIVNIIEAAPEEIDAVRIIEDWGIQTGLMFSKELWYKFIKPCYDRIHEAILKKGFYAMHHSCGDVTELLPEIIDLKTSILDSCQPECMDLKKIKEKYGKDIVLFGGLGSQSTIPNGTVSEVIEEAEKALVDYGQGGGYIIGPAGSVPTEAPIENVIALVEWCQNLKNR
ncbi:MAG: uroporphyrinogen decarboxylase family protein [Suipraeoptans sp.]